MSKREPKAFSEAFRREAARLAETRPVTQVTQLLGCIGKPHVARDTWADRLVDIAHEYAAERSRRSRAAARREAARRALMFSQVALTVLMIRRGKATAEEVRESRQHVARPRRGQRRRAIDSQARPR